MSETPTSSPEPATAPVAGPPPVVRDEPRRSKLTAAAAWVGIVAGVVFIVAVIFFSGFILGAHSGDHRGGGGHKGDHGFVQFHRGPPPFMLPPPGGPGFGPGGPRFAPPQPPGGSQGPGQTTPPPRPS